MFVNFMNQVKFELSILSQKCANMNLDIDPYPKVKNQAQAYRANFVFSRNHELSCCFQLAYFDKKCARVCLKIVESSISVPRHSLFN